MGGDPIPGPLDPLVEWFEEWKATLQKVELTLSRDYVKGPVHVTDYLHGNLKMKREASTW